MPCSHVRPMMALKEDKVFYHPICTFRTMSLAWTSNPMSHKEVVEAPLNFNSIHGGFSRADDGNPICLNADTYNRSAELLRLTKIRLIS